MRSAKPIAREKSLHVTCKKCAEFFSPPPKAFLSSSPYFSFSSKKEEGKAEKNKYWAAKATRNGIFSAVVSRFLAENWSRSTKFDQSRIGRCMKVQVNWRRRETAHSVGELLHRSDQRVRMARERLANVARN